MLFVKKSRRRGNLDKEDEVDGIVSDAFQLSSTREGKVGLVSHICSNRNVLGDFGSKWSMISKMGQWSDLTLGRWCISEAGKAFSHWHSPILYPTVLWYYIAKPGFVRNFVVIQVCMIFGPIWSVILWLSSCLERYNSVNNLLVNSELHSYFLFQMVETFVHLRKISRNVHPHLILGIAN